MSPQQRLVVAFILIACTVFGDAATNTVTALNTFPLPFRPVDVQFDPARPILYATDKAGKALHRVNITTGVVVKKYQFAYEPERMAMTPNGKRLYVALLTRPHDTYWFDEEGHVGRIAEIDLATGNLLREFEINEDPYDIVATDYGILLVTSGSGQHTKIRSYRISTGKNLGSAWIYQRSRLTLHPSQTAVYTTDTFSGPIDIARYNLDPVIGSLSAAADSPYHGDYPMGGNLFAHPNGTLLIDRGGSIFRSSTNHQEDMTYVRSLERGFCEDVAFDATRPAMFTVVGKDLKSGRPSLLDFYNRKTLELAATYRLPDSARFVGVKSQFVYVVSPGLPTSLLRRYPNPAVGMETNKSPVARFAWSPTNSTTQTHIVFDASTSTDENPAQLQYRWDWNSDGIFDTSFSSRRFTTNRFNTAGTKTVTLQVKDRFGALAQTNRVMNVALESDPGEPGFANVPYEFPFFAAHVLFDPKRPYAYASDRDSQRLVQMNLTNGLVERVFSFQSQPERMVLSPDGDRLYLALTPPPTLEGQIQGGYIAEFDLQQNVKSKEIAISRNAVDLAATDSGTLLITTGSYSPIVSYDLSTGTELSSYDTSGYLTRLALHPSQQAIYFSDWSSPFQKLEITAGGSLTNYRVFYLPDAFVSDFKLVFLNETNVVSTGGRVYSITNAARTDFQLVATLDSGEAAETYVDSPHGAFFRLQQDDYSISRQLIGINLDTLRAFSTNEVTDGTTFVGGYGNEIFTAYRDWGWEETRISRFTNPAAGLKTNIAPVANFTWDATNISTVTDVTFNASLSTDDSGTVGLTYRWDWNNDGVFDTPFSDSNHITKRFNTSGTRSVTLEVQDGFGAFHQNTQTFTVALASDPGVPGQTNEPFNLPFTPAHVVFDSINGFLYASDSPGKRLVKLNLANGLIEREFRFENTPERMVITPDGNRLYLALLSRPHTYNTPLIEDGHIAEFDLQAGVKTKEFAIAQDPFDLAATDDGLLIVSGGSGELADVSSYDIATGKNLGREKTIGPETELTLHPSQKAVYFTGYYHAYKLEIQPDGNLSRPYFFALDNNVSNHKIRFTSETNSVITSGAIFSNSIERTKFQMVGQLQHGEASDMAVDTASSALFTVFGHTYYYDDRFGKCAVYDLNSLAPIYAFDVTHTVRYVGSTVDAMWLVYVDQHSSRVERFPNPAIGAATNTAPVANFRWSPESPGTFTETVFDGSLSSDNLDRPEDLFYRWDWENDGVFDTEFVRRTNATVVFRTAGPRNVTLEVKDRLGLTNRVTKLVNIEAVPDPGEAYEGTNAPFTLPFIPYDTAFDPHGPYLYASDDDGRRVVKFNLTNGVIERVFRTQQRPKHLALTPDGRRMYVGAMQEYFEDWEFGSSPSTIAEFDLLTGTKTQEFFVHQKPYSLAATDGGVIGVAGEESFRTYSRTNGMPLDDLLTLHQTRVVFDPFQNAFYTGSQKFRINPETGRVTNRTDSVLYSEPFVHPDGIHLIDISGGVYRKINGTEQGISTLGSFFNGIHFHTNYSTMLTYYHDTIQVYNSRSLEYVDTIYADTEIFSLGTWNDAFYLVTRTNNESLVSALPHPMAEGKTNQPPIPEFTWTPQPATTFSPVHFNAIASFDDGPHQYALQFRWDFDGDGYFEVHTQYQLAQHRFPLGGTYRVGLQVRDPLGEVASIYKDVFVETANISDGSLLWRHNDGRTAVWTMIGGVRVRSDILASGQTLIGWKVGGIADFNGDGHRDILWTYDGRMPKVWCLNGTELLESVRLMPNLPAGWYVKGVGDFNADSHADLLLQNSAGSVSVRLMDRTNFVSSVPLRDGVPVNTNWTFAGIGDLNGDLHPDILWRGLNNNLAAWFMFGTSVGWNSAVKGPSMSSEWSVMGVDDHNGDERDDILWRNRVTGELIAWIMTGAQYPSYLHIIAPGAAPTNWRLLNSP